jgi:hypothetical protein
MSSATKELDLYVTVTRGHDFVDGITLTQTEAELAVQDPETWVQKFASAVAAKKALGVSYDILLSTDEGDLACVTVEGEFASWRQLWA